MTQHQPRLPRTRSKTRASYPVSDFHEKYENMNGKDGKEWTDGEGDDAWEDEEQEVHHADHERTASPSGSASAYARSTPRKRRRPTFPVNGSRRQVPSLASSMNIAKPPARAKPEGEERPVIGREDVVNGAVDGAVFTGKFAIDVFARAVRFLRYPLSIILFFWLLGFIMIKLRHTLQSAFAPLCIIPGISSSAICRWDTKPLPGKKPPQWADYPRLVEAESKTFEQLMDGFVGGSALSLEVKQAEMATTDLVALIRISDLKAKNTLATSLMDFIEDAKKTGRGLQKLSSKVGGAVDNIMAVNDYALKSIESARASQPSSWAFTVPAIWKPKRKATDAIVTETFEEAMNVLSNNLQRLIVEAEVSHKNLNDLEERLVSLHELVSREDSSISSAKSDLLAELWTKLGGNKRKLRNFDGHLALLKDLATYRKQAVVHVVAALQTLRGMSDDMEDMRERVAAPDLVGSSVPAEVHMKSIEMGLQRLREGRIRAKKLEDEAIRRVLSINGLDDDDE